MPDEAVAVTIVPAEAVTTESATIETAVVEVTEQEATARTEIREDAETERARIAAETERQAIEAAERVASAVTREEMDECRRNLEAMQQIQLQQGEQLGSILATLEALNRQANPPPPVESVEVTPGSPEVQGPAEAPKPRKKVALI